MDTSFAGLRDRLDVGIGEQKDPWWVSFALPGHQTASVEPSGLNRTNYVVAPRHFLPHHQAQERSSVQTRVQAESFSLRTVSATTRGPVNVIVVLVVEDQGSVGRTSSLYQTMQPRGGSCCTVAGPGS